MTVSTRILKREYCDVLLSATRKAGPPQIEEKDQKAFIVAETSCHPRFSVILVSKVAQGRYNDRPMDELHNVSFKV